MTFSRKESSPLLVYAYLKNGHIFIAVRGVIDLLLLDILKSNSLE